MHEDTGHHVTAQKGHEVSDIQVKYVLYLGLGLVVLTFIGYVIGTATTLHYRAQPAIGDYRPTPVAIEEEHSDWNLPVRLQVDPPRAQVEFKSSQNAGAAAFGEVSDQPEIYRIPVETAMKIVAERGLPVFPKVMAPAEGEASQ